MRLWLKPSLMQALSNISPIYIPKLPQIIRRPVHIPHPRDTRLDTIRQLLIILLPRQHKRDLPAIRTNDFAKIVYTPLLADSIVRIQKRLAFQRGLDAGNDCVVAVAVIYDGVASGGIE
jgi:hypothetical protein